MQQLPQSQDSAPLRGLSTQQAEALRAQGLSNQQSDTGGKSAGEIIRSNALTFFNLIFVVIAVLLCLVGSYRNLTFLPVVIGNTLIGIFQELRAKRILDKMSLLHAPHAVALRDGAEQKLAANDLVRAYGMLDVKLNKSLIDNIMILGLRHAVEPLDPENQPVRWELP